MNIPKKIFANELLRLFSSSQIRIPNKEIRIPQQTFQFWSFSSKFKEGDSTPFQSDSNPLSRKCRLTKAIRIPPIAIRIHFPKCADWRRRFESLPYRFESTFQRVQTNEGDSNPSWRNSNPNSSKQIKGDRFESLIKRFESHMKKEEKLRATDSNPLLAIRIPHKNMKKELKKGFESPT